MKTIPQTRRNEEGYVLVAALVTLLLLTVLGIWASRTTSMDLHMAANERVHQEAFYQADAATHIAERLINHDWICLNRKQKAWLDTDSDKLPGSITFKSGIGNGKAPLREGKYVPMTAKEEEDDPGYRNGKEVYTFRYCLETDDAAECAKLTQENEKDYGYTNVLVGSKQVKLPGAGSLFNQSRDGEAVSSGKMNVYYQYVIKAHHVGRNKSESRVSTAWQWREPEVDKSQDREDCHY